MAQVATAILKRRQERIREFGGDFFGEPAWEIILDLYVRESFEASTTVTQLAIDLALCPSSIGRWLSLLEQRGLVARSAHPLPGGMDYVELSSHGRETLTRYMLTAQKVGIEE